jgi:cadmium resistance protein CadD (predicted permease)
MLLFFSRARTEYPDIKVGYAKVMIGQTIGFTIVMIISLIGMALGLIIPADYINLVGFFPLCMGLAKLYEIIAEQGICCCFYPKIEEEGDKVEPDVNHYQGDLEDTYVEDARGEYDAQISDRDYAKLLRVDSTGKSLADDQRHLLDTDDVKVVEEEESNIITSTVKYFCKACLDPFILEVTLFALFCSSDNIGIYVAIFISLDPVEVSIVVALFYIMLFMSIIGAMVLVQYDPVAKFFENNASYLVPALLIPLGLYILSDSIIWPF